MSISSDEEVDSKSIEEDNTDESRSSDSCSDEDTSRKEKIGKSKSKSKRNKNKTEEMSSDDDDSNSKDNEASPELIEKALKNYKKAQEAKKRYYEKNKEKIKQKAMEY